MRTFIFLILMLATGITQAQMLSNNNITSGTKVFRAYEVLEGYGGFIVNVSSNDVNRYFMLSADDGMLTQYGKLFQLPNYKGNVKIGGLSLASQSYRLMMATYTRADASDTTYGQILIGPLQSARNPRTLESLMLLAWNNATITDQLKQSLETNLLNINSLTANQRIKIMDAIRQSIKTTYKYMLNYAQAAQQAQLDAQKAQDALSSPIDNN